MIINLYKLFFKKKRLFYLIFFLIWPARDTHKEERQERKPPGPGLKSGSALWESSIPNHHTTCQQLLFSSEKYWICLCLPLLKWTLIVFDSTILRIDVVIKYFISFLLFLFSSILTQKFFASNCFSLTIWSFTVYTTNLIFLKCCFIL